MSKADVLDIEICTCSFNKYSKAFNHSGCCWLHCITSQTLTQLAIPLKCKNISELKNKL